MSITLYLDTDGCVSPWNKNTTIWGRGWNDFRTHHLAAGGYELSKRMGGALNRLDAEICWVGPTALYSDMKVGPLIGIPEGNQTMQSSAFHKEHELILIDQGVRPRPFIWIDDTKIPPIRHQFELWMAEHLPQINYLLLDIPAGHGITKANIKTMEDFISKQPLFSSLIAS